MENKLVSFVLFSVLWQLVLCLSSSNFTIERKWCGTKELNIRCVDVSKTNCRNDKYRSMDGSCNNLRNPAIGMSITAFKRLLPADYSDRVYSLPRSVSGSKLPSARLLSYKAFGRRTIGDPYYTNLNQQWGQVVTHDTSLRMPDGLDGVNQLEVKTQKCCSAYGRYEIRNSSTPCAPIPVPNSDPYFKNYDCIDFDRSVTEKDQGCRGAEGSVPAEQLNGVTHYLDLNLIYGNSIAESRHVRELRGGFLKTSDYNQKWPPQSDRPAYMCQLGNPGDVCYEFGDPRGNQNLGLTTLSIIFLREHNRIARELAEMNRHWDDETLFQEARRINIAQYQYITYYEWNPNFYGYERMKRYKLIYETRGGEYVNDYDQCIDPRSIQEFQHATFRHFHHQIMGYYEMVTESRRVKKETLRLTRYQDKPGVLEEDLKFNKVLRGMCTQHMGLTDMNVDIEAAERFVLGSGLRGKDLKAFDIQRGRDHGIARYNNYREFCGLKRAKSWADYTDFISEKDVQLLRKLYESHEDVDLLVGGAMERHEPYSLVGPTFLCINLIQFHDVRKGDRYFFENGNQPYPFTPDQLAEIRKASAARLMCDNADIEQMQRWAFEHPRGRNSLRRCSELPKVDLRKWKDRKY